MKRLFVILLLFLFVGCSKDDDGGCSCYGEFTVFGQGGSFYVDDVDCDTGQPVIDNQGDTPTIFLGCVN